jgi:ketosteroid isomerase-like protein
MSRENVEVVRSIYRAFARRDRHALVADLDPSIRVHDRPSHPDASVYEGPEGFLRFSETDWEAFEAVVYEPQDFVANGAYVIVPIKQSGKGKSSTLAIEEGIVNVWKLRRAPAAVYCRLSLSLRDERWAAHSCCGLLRFAASTALPQRPTRDRRAAAA